VRLGLRQRADDHAERREGGVDLLGLVEGLAARARLAHTLAPCEVGHVELGDLAEGEASTRLSGWVPRMVAGGGIGGWWCGWCGWRRGWGWWGWCGCLGSAGERRALVLPSASFCCSVSVSSACERDDSAFISVDPTMRLAFPHARHSSTSNSPITFTSAKPSTYTPLPPRLTSSRICRPPARFVDPSGLQSVAAGCNKSRTT
jgi:hypothetical protein